MSKRILIDRFCGNFVGVLAEDNKLLEFHVEKLSVSQIVGSIYKGRVTDVLNGLTAAFVNVGLDKNGYLYVGETLVDKNELVEKVQIPTTLTIKEGDEIMVQAVKDPVGNKGVRLTTNLSFASRNLVYVPSFSIRNVSRKITDEKIREKLFSYVEKLSCKEGGFIARTRAETASFQELKKEAKNLVAQYEEVKDAYQKADACSLIYEDGNLAYRMLRDVYTEEVDEIVVADEEIYQKLFEVTKSRAPEFKKKLKHYDGKTDLIEKYGLADEIKNITKNKADLDIGGYLIIDKTEALTVIDVNTGSYVGSDNLEDTVYQVNVSAVKEIARQVRLRNIGGIVVVDFIDMQLESHRKDIVELLTKELSKDRIKCNVLGMTGLGLVEFTRQKKRKEISAYLNKDCPYCHGEGKIASNDYIVMRIRTALLDLFLEDYTSAIIDLNVDIADYLVKTGVLNKDVEKYFSDKRIYLIPHKTYHQEFFLVKGEKDKVLNLPEKAIFLN